MKIAMVNHNLGSGGAEKLIYDMTLLLKEYKNLNVDIILLTKQKCIYGEELKKQGVNVIYLSDKWDIYSPKNIYRLSKLLKIYDIVHTHTYSSQLWTAFASYFLPKTIQYITTEHNTSNRRRNKKLFKLLDKWMYSRYHKIISISSATENNLKNWLEVSYNSKKYKIVPNGIDLKRFAISKKIFRKDIDINLKDNDILITMVARFEEQKDYETLIKAIHQLKNEKIKLLLVGEGKLKNSIIRLVNELSLDSKVIFLNFRKDIPELLKTSDIFVLSSNWEGFGIVAVEAMASGLPTIVSNVDGLRDVVENAGIIFEKGNYQELSNKIKFLINNETYRKEIEKKCLEKSKEYSIDRMVQDYKKIYSKGEM